MGKKSMPYKEIAAMEAVRTTIQECRTIHMVKSGTFYQMHNWSSWLCCRFVSDFKVHHRSYDGVQESMTMVGFPVQSLSKNIPEGSVVTEQENEVIDVLLPDALFSELDTIETMAAEYANWKSCQPLEEKQEGKESKGKTPINEQSFGKRQLGIFDVLRRLFQFPIESASPLECQRFLIELRNELARFF